jgi:hypothetical protein
VADQNPKNQQPQQPQTQPQPQAQTQPAGEGQPSIEEFRLPSGDTLRSMLGKAQTAVQRITELLDMARQTVDHLQGVVQAADGGQQPPQALQAASQGQPQGQPQQPQGRPPQQKPSDQLGL